MKKQTVSIGIPAYNEQQNIRTLLKSILKQKTKDFEVIEICVYSDGSSDKTVQVVRSLRNKKIKVIDGKQRLGQSARISQIIKNLKGDFIVIFDADVELAENHTLENLVKILNSNKDVGLVSGTSYPKDGETFIEKCVNSSVFAYLSLKREINSGDNVYSCVGRSLGLSRNFARQIFIPRDVFANDSYLYFECLKRGLKFKYISEAKVLFRSPATISDHIKQNKRFLRSKDSLRPYFCKEIDREFDIPKALLVKHLVMQFVKNPVYSLSIFFINLYCRFLVAYGQNDGNVKWEISGSTKKGASYV